MNTHNYKDLFVSKENKVVLVLDPSTDSTIQKMIGDATSKDIESYISLELEDIKAIVDAEGLTSTISSTGRGDNTHKKSLQPLIEHYKNYKSVKAILISFTIHETFPIMELQEAINDVCEVFNKEEEILFSVLIDNMLADDEVQANIIIKRHEAG